MASLAAAASLALSKVTKPKPRERVGFSLEDNGSELLRPVQCRMQTRHASPVHGDECVEHFAVPAERFNENFLVCVPREIADVTVKISEGSIRHVIRLKNV